MDSNSEMRQQARDLFQVQSGNYRPPTGAHVPFSMMGMPPFTIRSVEMMRRDPQVKLAMAVKAAPIMKPKFEIKGRPDIVEYVAKMLRVIWTNAITEIISGFWYTRSAMENVWKEDQQTGQVRFDSVRPFCPSDATILTRNGDLYGIRVQIRDSQSGAGGDLPANDSHNSASSGEPKPGKVDLIGPKGFCYVHKREFGSWDGISEFEGAYDPWLEKNDIKGAKAIRKTWFYKNAFDSGMMFCPPGVYTDPTDPTGQRKIPWRDIARMALESSQTGAVWVFESMYDPDTKQPLWRFERPTMNGNGDILLAYPKDLDRDILHGFEIPDDIVSQVSGSGGGFAGRTIPLMSFFLSQNAILQKIVSAVKSQILDPGCLLNFGSTDYEIQDAEINIDALMPQPPGQSNATAGDVGAEGDDLQQQDGGKVSDVQDVESAVGGMSKDQQKQLSQGMAHQIGAMMAGYNTASIKVRLAL